MATYTKLHEIMQGELDGWQDLRNKVRAAMSIAGSIIATGADTAGPPWDQAAGQHEQRVLWVAQEMLNETEVSRVFNLVVAKERALSNSAILGLSDTDIQDDVNEIIDTLAADL